MTKTKTKVFQYNGSQQFECKPEYYWCTNRELLIFSKMLFLTGSSESHNFLKFCFRELNFQKGDQNNERMGCFFAIAKIKCQLWNVRYCILHSIFSSFSSNCYTDCTYGTKIYGTFTINLFYGSRTMFPVYIWEKKKTTAHQCFKTYSLLFPFIIYKHIVLNHVRLIG